MALLPPVKEKRRTLPRGLKILCAVVALAGGGAAFFALRGCQNHADAGPSADGLVSARIGGRPFALEPALDDQARFKGLGDRESIAPDGGMLFVFPYASPHSFVMRDCPIDIDIAFLNDAGYIVALHEMKAEDPRREGESDVEYNARLRQYPSRFPVRLAVEVAGGTFARLGVEAGDKIEIANLAGLKAEAR